MAPRQELDDPEQTARLLGLMSQLGLPPRVGADGKTRRVLVEVEVAPGVWSPVDSAALDDERLVLSYGTNGRRREWKFRRGEPVPRWRLGDTSTIAVGV